MKYLNQNEKGLTLLEIIIVFGILGIILTILGNFTLTSMKHYSMADDEVEIQYHAQIAMNELIDKVMRTKGIKTVDGLATISFYDSTKQKVKKISFDNAANTDPTMKTLVIEHKYNELFYGYGNSATILFANYIDTFIIKPMPLGKTYEDCLGIQISIKIKKKDSELLVENEIYFRN